MHNALVIRYVRGVAIKEAVKCTVNYAAPNDRKKKKKMLAGSLWSLTKSCQNVQVYEGFTVREGAWL